MAMNFCSTTCPTVGACMLIDQHSSFAGCRLDSEVLSAAQSDLLENLLRKC